MIVKVFINERLVATAQAVNQSGLAPVSDYDAALYEIPPRDGAGIVETTGRVEGHARDQSVWALVAKVAALRADGEGPR